MKANLKRYVIAIMMILMVVAVGTSSIAVDAADTTNYSVGMSLTSESKLKAGDVVTVKINVTSVNAGDGIDTLGGKLEYDSNVFETPIVSDITSSTDWTPKYAPTTNMMTLQKDSKITSAETLATISFKVKSTISVNSTTIKISTITVSGGSVMQGGTGDIEVNPISVTINAEKAATSTTGSSTQTSVKDNSTTKTTALPKAGLGQLGLISIIVLAAVGIFSYALYKKTEKYVK